MPVFLIGMGSILGLIYFLWRIHLLLPLIIAITLVCAFKLAPTSDFVVGLKCANVPQQTTVCADLARAGWTRGWILKAYGYRLVGDHYMYTRSTPDLTVRAQFRPTGSSLYDWWEGGGGLPF
jgi:hypothetical protein